MMVNNFDSMDLTAETNQNLAILYKTPSLTTRNIKTNASGILEVEPASLTKRIAEVFFSSVGSATITEKALDVVLKTLDELKKALTIPNQLINHELKSSVLTVINKINTLDLTTFPIFQTTPLRHSLIEINHLIDEDIAFVEETCPELVIPLQNAKIALKVSENPETNYSLRLRCTPRPPSESGVSGSYFVSALIDLPKTQTAEQAFQHLQTRPVEDIQTSISFIVKPSVQEPKVIASAYEEGKKTVATSSESITTGFNPPNQEFFRGITPGSSAIRERIGYHVQQELGFSCGISPTAVTRFSHEMLGAPTELDQLVNELNTSLGNAKIKKNELLQLFIPEKNVSEVIDELCAQAVSELEHIISEDLLDQFQVLFQAAPNIRNMRELENFLFEVKFTNEALVTKFQKLHFNTNGFVTEKILMLTNLTFHIEKIIPLLEKIKLTIHKSPKLSLPSLASFQQFVPNCRSLFSLSDEEKKSIPPSEYGKFVIDLVLINSDRHLGNILTKPVKKETLLATFIDLDIPESEVITSLNSSESEFLEKIAILVKNHSHEFTSSLEETATQLYYAHNNNLDQIRQLVLIDHGACLPDPRKMTISSIRHDWVSFIGNLQLSPLIKKSILALNVEEFVERIREDQLYHFEQFGDKCSIPVHCYDLMQLNLLWIQASINEGLSIEQISAFSQPVYGIESSQGQMHSLYQNNIFQVIQRGEKINWEFIQEELKAIAENYKK